MNRTVIRTKSMYKNQLNFYIAAQNCKIRILNPIYNSLKQNKIKLQDLGINITRYVKPPL